MSPDKGSDTLVDDGKYKTDYYKKLIADMNKKIENRLKNSANEMKGVNNNECIK